MFSIKYSAIFIILFFFNFSTWAHVNLLNPKGGEIYLHGQIVNIEWMEVLNHNSQNWDILFSSDGGVTWDTVKSDIPISTMNYSWEIPNVITQTGRIKVVQDNVEVDYDDVSEDFTITSVTDVEDQLEVIKVNIFPNPITEFSIIEFENPESHSLTFTLYNSRGQLIRTLKEIKTNRIRLDLIDLSKGIYFYQLNSSKEFYASGNFIVQ